MSYRRIIVGDSPAGFSGIDELFTELYQQGHQPGEQGLGESIVERLRQENYIPRSARAEYAAAFLREYGAFVADKNAGTTIPRGYRTWRGYPREQIPWFPMLDEDLCDGCGACVRLCSGHALIMGEDGKAHVNDQWQCVVGCSSCAELCKVHAITFPSKDMLKMWPPRGWSL